MAYDKKLIAAFLKKKAEEENRFTDKEHRQHEHIMRSEEEAGKSKEEADKIGWATVQKDKKASQEEPCWDGYEMAGTKKKNGKDVPNCIPKKAKNLINEYLKKEAYGVQMSPGSGGNYSMGPSIDTTSRTSIQPGQGASEPTFQYKTKDKTVPKKQMQPGMDPIIPGKVKEQNRYTGPEQRVVQKPNSNVKMKAPYDKSTFDQSALERLYPSLFEQKSPNQISKFTDWLKGLHQKYLAKPQPEVQAPQPMATEARKEILSLVKTAVQDSNNNYKIALQALHEMGYTSENILKALTSKKSR